MLFLPGAGIPRRLADKYRLDSLPWAASDFHWKSSDTRHFVFASAKTSSLVSARSIPATNKLIIKNDQAKHLAIFYYVPGAGIEPARPKPQDFKSCASTNSATRAFRKKYYHKNINKSSGKYLFFMLQYLHDKKNK